MKYIATIYPGNYHIKSLGGIDYIHCENPHEDELIFEGKGYTKDFFQEILTLNIDDLDSIMAFINQYGILVNTQNNSDIPLYLGKITSSTFHDNFLSFPSGIFMPLCTFKHFNLHSAAFGWRHK